MAVPVLVGFAPTYYLRAYSTRFSPREYCCSRYRQRLWRTTAC